MEYERYAAVPGPDGESLVVVDGRLPRIEELIDEPVFLRTGGQAVCGERVLRFCEFDAAERGDVLPFAHADPERLVPPELKPFLEHWLAEQQGAPIPELRPPWSRPGWHAQAEEWAGCALRRHRVWPISAVLAGDGVFFKAVFRGFRQEPAITEALSHEHPGLVPDVIRIDVERGWMLMRPLDGTPASQDDPEPAFRTLATIQDTWRDRTDELLALGAQDRRLHVLAASVAADAPELAEVVRRLEARGEAETIGHGDFHADNVMIDPHGRAAIYDWSDACITHPSFDRHIYRFHDDDPIVATASCLHQAESYRAILENLAPDDRWWFAGDPRRWLQLARENAARPG